MLFERNKNNILICRTLEAELLFNDILCEIVKTPQELEYCIEALSEALAQAAHDWLEDEGYEDFYDHCQIEVYFDEDLEKAEE